MCRSLTLQVARPYPGNSCVPCSWPWCPLAKPAEKSSASRRMGDTQKVPWNDVDDEQKRLKHVIC